MRETELEPAIFLAAGVTTGGVSIEFVVRGDIRLGFLLGPMEIHAALLPIAAAAQIAVERATSVRPSHRVIDVQAGLSPHSKEGRLLTMTLPQGGKLTFQLTREQIDQTIHALHALREVSDQSKPSSH